MHLQATAKELDVPKEMLVTKERSRQGHLCKASEFQGQPVFELLHVIPAPLGKLPCRRRASHVLHDNAHQRLHVLSDQANLLS